MPIFQETSSFKTRFTKLQEDLITRVHALAENLSHGPDLDKSEAVDDIRWIGETGRAVQSLLSEVQNLPDADMADKGAHLRMTHEMTRLRYQFARWGDMQALIERQMSFGPEPLSVPDPTVGTARYHQTQTHDRIFHLLHAFVSPHAFAGEAEAKGGFPDIAVMQSLFLREMNAAHRIILARRLGRPARFLDVGCGCGLKVLSAAQYFEQSDGLDFVPAYVEVAQKLFDITGLSEASAFEADAFAFEGYDAYDVIYFYRPIQDDATMRKLEEHILAHAKPDALIVAPYPHFLERFADLGCARIAGHVFLAQGSEEEADALRRRAEYMGHGLPQTWFSGDPLWEPISIALRDNGFQQAPPKHARTLKRFG